MELNNLLMKIREQKKCPEDCSFKNKEGFFPIVISPPKFPKIILISNDPTDDFVPIYNYSKKYAPEERRLVLFMGAIPYQLLVRISKFYKANPNINVDFNVLFKLLDLSYWTHLCKCYTVKRKKITFSRKCADIWLREEINACKKLGAKAIVCLGSDVRKWMEKEMIGDLKIIKIPHPSGLSRPWNNPKKIEEIHDQIKCLIDVLDNDIGEPF